MFTTLELLDNPNFINALYDENVTCGRVCPECGKIIGYRRFKIMQKAQENNWRCSNCAAKVSHPRNKNFSRTCPICGELAWHNSENAKNRGTYEDTPCGKCRRKNNPKSNKQKFLRKCPNFEVCNKQISYLSILSLEKAEIEKTLCRHCYSKNAQKRLKIDGVEYRKTYERKCPECQEIIRYINEDAFKKANRKNNLCASCGKKNRKFKFFRDCPSCGNIIKYVHEKGKNKAENENQVCLGCIAIKHNNDNKSKRVGWIGKYENHNFRSLAELTYIISLEEININWISGEKDKNYIISYTDENGKTRKYFPDFILPSEKKIIEIKPLSQWNNPNVLAKKKYAEEFAKNIGFTYELKNIQTHISVIKIKELCDKKIITLSKHWYERLIKLLGTKNKGYYYNDKRRNN